MASISFDRSTGWWSVRYYAGPARGRVKKSLCKHPGAWSEARPPKRAPEEVMRLAAPFREAERLAKLGQEAAQVRRTVLASYTAAYLDRSALTLAENTRTAVRIASDKFLAYCGDRGIKYLQDVTYAVCRDWIAARLKAGANRSTVVTERSNLRPMWGQAMAERLVAENPWESARVPGKARREIPTAWTREEVTRLVAEFGERDWIRDMIQVGLNTGIRITALLALRWPQVDWEAGLIRVRAADSKSGRPYEIPITATTHDVLSRRLATGVDPGGLVFPSRLGKPFSPRTTFERIKRAVKRSGIPDHGDYNHVLRRTFATVALNSGVPLEVVSRCLDHATLAQTQRAYAHVLADRLKAGMAGFDLPGGGITPPPGSSP